MLMLKGPLQLYTTNPILTYSDQLGSKILGNYSLMSLSITPQDLLHITMHEPEIYVEQENGGTVLIENHISNTHQDNLEFMNQFINRIMLVDTPQFTYQDEVFVSTVLKKLGIMNISEFISQVRKTTEHTELLQNLVNRYFEEGTVIKQAADRILQKDYIQTEKQIITEGDENALAESVYMNIAKRLHVAENNNILYEYTRPAATGVLLNHYTMTLMPFIEQSDMIELQQLRNDIYRQNIENVMPQINAYENMEFHLDEVTQDHVTGALNSAILLNLIKDVNYERNQSFYADRYFWQDYRKVMYGNALDTFQRFEDYQQQEIANLTDKRQYIDHMTRLYQDEYSMVEMLFRTSDLIEEPEENPGNSIAEHTYLSLMDNQSLQQILTQGDKISNKIAKNIVNAKYYADDVTILNQLKNKEESILLLKEIAKENLDYITLSEHETNVMQNNVFKIEKLRQYFEEQNQNTNMLSYENVVSKYLQILKNLRQNLYDGKYIDDMNQEIHLLEQIENIHITKKQDAFWEINGKVFTNNEASEYISNLITRTENLEQQLHYKATTQQSYDMTDIKEQLRQDITNSSHIAISKVQKIDHVIGDMTHMEWSHTDVENGTITEEQYQEYLLQNQYHMNAAEQMKQEVPDRSRVNLTQLEVNNVKNLEELTHLVLDQSQVQNSHMTEQEYIAYLDAINEKNLHMKQILKEATPIKHKTGKVVVDRKEALKQSLRALENPEEVIREIYENSRTIEREIPANIRQYLELTDESTRMVLEEVMGIRSHGAISESTEQIERHISTVEQILKQETERIEENLQTLERPETISEETKNILLHYMNQIEMYENQIRDENTIVDTTLKIVAQELTENVNRIENNLTHLVKSPITNIEALQQKEVAVPRQIVQNEVTQMIHKEKQQLRDEIKEEVLHSLDRIQIHNTQEIDYQQVESMTQKQIEETKREIIKRQQETIQEIVNRKLMTQMGTISDKVYKDIERKLQGERRRRGY